MKLEMICQSTNVHQQVEGQENISWYNSLGRGWGPVIASTSGNTVDVEAQQGQGQQGSKMQKSRVKKINGV